MEKSQYISIMIQSLKKKSAVLDTIMELNIQQLELLDNGFQELYEKVREELQSNREAYREDIACMQEYIRKLTDKSATIQAQEARNKDLMTQKFASVRKQVKEVRKSQKVVNQYYKSMMKANYMEAHFTDNKK